MFQQYQVLPCKHRKKKSCLTDSALAYPDLIHVVWLHFPQCRPVKIFSVMFTNGFISQFKAFFTSVNTPVIVLNEFNKFFLTVGFTRDDDGFIHEGLVEIHFIQLQAQTLSNLQKGVAQFRSIEKLSVSGFFKGKFTCIKIKVLL